MVLTRTPRPASSAAQVRAKERIAALDAAYTLNPGVPLVAEDEPQRYRGTVVEKRQRLLRGEYHAAHLDSEGVIELSRCDVASRQNAPIAQGTVGMVPRMSNSRAGGGLRPGARGGSATRREPEDPRWWHRLGWLQKGTGRGGTVAGAEHPHACEGWPVMAVKVYLGSASAAQSEVTYDQADSFSVTAGGFLLIQRQHSGAQKDLAVFAPNAWLRAEVVPEPRLGST